MSPRTDATNRLEPRSTSNGTTIAVEGGMGSKPILKSLSPLKIDELKDDIELVVSQGAAVRATRDSCWQTISFTD